MAWVTVKLHSNWTADTPTGRAMPGGKCVAGDIRGVPRAQASTSSLNVQAENSLPVEKCSDFLADKESADLLSDTTYGYPSGRCIEADGKLTGSCVLSLHVGPGCLEQANACPVGVKAKKPTVVECCGFRNCVQRSVDLDTGCR